MGSTRGDVDHARRVRDASADLREMGGTKVGRKKEELRNARALDAMTKTRRIIKVTLLSIAGVIGFLILAVAGWLIYDSFDNEDWFVLENAEFQEVGYLRRLDATNKPRNARLQDELFPVYAHRLKRGSGTVFAWRFYSNGKVFTIDDEFYRKVTLWIAASPPTSPTSISLGDESKAVLISCHGGSAWPGGECCGYGTAGSVTITPSGQGFIVAAQAEITPAGNSKTLPCVNEKVDRKFTANKIAFEDLTPWLGIADPKGRPYHETYRR